MADSRAFPGGIHPREIGNGKPTTQGCSIIDQAAPVRVVVAMAQHIGAPAKCVVNPGDTVAIGQVIGQAEGLISAPVHAPVSGKVVKLDRCVLPTGQTVPAVVIDNDFEDRWDAAIKPRTEAEVDKLTNEQLIAIVRDAGVVGLGGATFPTAVKLAPPKPVDTLIINGAECEPYLTADHRVMLEQSAAIADGVRLAKKMLGAATVLVGIEDNKPDAVAAMREALGNDAKVVSLPVRYPQGGEKQLIYALTGRVVPIGKLPADVGTVVINVGTAAAISAAVREGKPLIDHVVTVSGRVANPANVRVRIGTTLADVVDGRGGFTDGVDKIVLGGPMMGFTVPRLDIPMIKGLSGILGMSRLSEPELPCIRCGRCAEACPMNLLPMKIDAAARRYRWDLAEGLQVAGCMECGTCSYVCPAKREVTQGCKTAKAGIKAAAAQKKA